MILETQDDHLALYYNLIVQISIEGDKVAKKIVLGKETSKCIKKLGLLIALGNIMCKYVVPGTVVDTVTIVESDNCLTQKEIELLWDYIATKCKLCNC